MFFLWGFKEVARKKGYVAEMCATCNEVQITLVKRVGLALHAFYIPLTRGPFIKAIGKCSECNSKFSVDITKYTSFRKKANNTNIDTLIAETNPNVWRSDYLEIDNVIKILLKYENPTMIFSRFDRMSAWTCILTFAIPITLGLIISEIPKKPETDLLMANFLLILFCIGLFISFITYFLEPRRTFNRKVLPKLIKDLSILSVSKSELEDSMKRLESRNSPMNKFINADQLYRKLYS